MAWESRASLCSGVSSASFSPGVLNVRIESPSSWEGPSLPNSLSQFPLCRASLLWTRSRCPLFLFYFGHFCVLGINISAAKVWSPAFI
jgi:hypothetical protein